MLYKRLRSAQTIVGYGRYRIGGGAQGDWVAPLIASCGRHLPGVYWRSATYPVDDVHQARNDLGFGGWDVELREGKTGGPVGCVFWSNVLNLNTKQNCFLCRAERHHTVGDTRPVCGVLGRCNGPLLRSVLKFTPLLH